MMVPMTTILSVHVFPTITFDSTYGVYVSQLIRISRICDNYVSFVKRHRLLTERLIKQGFWYNKLSISFKKFSRRHSMLFNKYAVSVKRHIREGICIPLDVKPNIVRNNYHY